MKVTARFPGSVEHEVKGQRAWFARFTCGDGTLSAGGRAAYDARPGQGHNEGIDPANGLIKYGDPHGWMDAYGRRSIDGEKLLHPPNHEDGWGWWGLCPPVFPACPSPTPTPTPQPSPGSTPTPGPTPDSGAICRGGWHAPDCSIYRVELMSTGVLNVQERSVVVSDCKHVQGHGSDPSKGECTRREDGGECRDGSERHPARVGDKIVMNSSPRYHTPTCPGRGAVIPDNCVIERFAYLNEWSISSGTINRDDGANSLGYLAKWTAESSGEHIVTACNSGVCKDSDPVHVQ